MTVQLNEDFASEHGQWTNYDAYDPTLRDTLREQKHIDIRSGISDDVTVPLNVLELSQRTMASLTGAPVSSLDASVKVVRRGEHWSRGVSAPMVTHNYWNSLGSTLYTGLNTFSSVIDTPTIVGEPAKRNLVPNPSFEINTSPFYTAPEGVTPALTLTRDTIWSWRGGASCRVNTGNHASINDRARVAIDILDIDNTLNYSSRVYVRPQIAGTNMELLVEWRNAANAVTGTSSTTFRTTEGELFRITDNPPNLTVKAIIYIVFTGFTGTRTFWIDGVYFGEGTLPSPDKYFDGYTPGYYWTGAPHSSPSEGPVPYTAEAMDLTTGFEDDDFISLTLPSFPLAQIDTATSFLDFTSGFLGTFNGASTEKSVALDQSLVPLVAGNSEFRILRSTMDQQGIDFERITGVRLRITALSSGSMFYVGALRLLAKDWKYSSVDMNTRYGELRRPWSRDGNPVAAVEFDQPIVWRAAEVPGQTDPKPIDFNLAVAFNTGSRQGSNNISMYGRELTEDFLQQLDINSLTMADLDGHDQPDLGQAMYNSRVQTDLEPFKQDQLKGLEQFDLERTPDYLSASWIQFVVQWTATTTQVSVVNTEGNGYNFNLGTPLAANTSYVLVFELEDTSARAAIYPLGARGQITLNAPVFDSTVINDDFSYKRRKGRFGWFANLADGDAYVESIRFRSASYAEYRSLPYESLTPVIGAELIAESSPVIDLFEFFAPTGTSVKVESDREVSVSGESFRVTDYGDFTYQGIRSNEFDITDFDQTEILLDVYYPSALDQTATLEFYLKNQADYWIALPRPKIYPDQWQTIRLRTPSSHLAQTGLYRFIIVQNNPVNLNWWVDNVRVFERTVSWHGRAYVEDPWAATEDDWTPFQNALNRDYGGILFQSRERRLQIKGTGHKQDSQVTKVQFKPKYAELGRFVWPEDAVTNLGPPVASYSTSNVGRTYTFNGFGSTDPDGQIINWYWTVSDGTVYVGPIIQHTFGQAGSYAVTLTVTDPHGSVNTTSAIHSVA